MLKKLKEKKGTSLIELIISIVLISIVLIFMFKLLLDVNNEQVNDVFAKDNQVIRAEIIRTIENEFSTNTISSIENKSTSTSGLIIWFTYKNGKKSILSATSSTLEFTNSAGQKRKWTLENCTLYTNKANVYVVQDDKANNYYSLIIDIEIHTTNDRNTAGNNNTQDDIMLSYLGKISDYQGNKPNTLTCLGKSC